MANGLKMKYETVIYQQTNSIIRMPISDDGFSFCPVCGEKFKNKSFRPYDRQGFPSYEICGCCGIQYGFDCEPDSAERDWNRYREKWLRNEIDFSVARKMAKNEKIQQLQRIEIKE